MAMRRMRRRLRRLLRVNRLLSMKKKPSLTIIVAILGLVVIGIAISTAFWGRWEIKLLIRPGLTRTEVHRKIQRPSRVYSLDEYMRFRPGVALSNSPRPENIGSFELVDVYTFRHLALGPNFCGVYYRNGRVVAVWCWGT